MLVAMTEPIAVSDAATTASATNASINVNPASLRRDLRLVDRLNRDPSGSPTCSHMKTNAKPPTLSSRSTTAEIRMLKPAADHDCIVWRAWPRRVILDGRAPDRPGPDD